MYLNQTTSLVTLKISLRQIKHFMGQDGGSKTKAGQGIGDDTDDRNKILVAPTEWGNSGH